MGGGGRTLKEIEKRTNTTIDVKDKHAYIQGPVQADREQAESDILKIVKEVSLLWIAINNFIHFMISHCLPFPFSFLFLAEFSNYSW